jgi:4-hydroxy-tetrahydrodipicolinate synthase
MYKPEGIIPALVTPFSKNRKQVNEAALRNLVRHCMDSGVDGVVACGSTGEFVNLTIRERKKVTEIVINEVNGKVPVIAGTGSSGTDQALELTKHAKDVGADAALIITPYYLKPSDRGMYEHYYTIANKVDLPIILYNFPQCTGAPLSWQMVEDLAQISNIVGLKDSSGQLTYIITILEKVRDKINVLTGSDETLVAALAVGCSGGILASANVIPDLWAKLYDAVSKGELETARRIQYKVQKIARIISKSGAVATKEALNMIGIEVGPVRLPLSVGGELSYEDREELRLELEKIGKVSPKPIESKMEGKVPEERFVGLEITPQTILDFNLRIGEALTGSGNEAAHIDLLVGKRDGPMGAAYVKAKSTMTPGHEPLIAILEPNLAVKPDTLILPTVTIRSMRQASMIYGPAQTAIAKAVADTVADGIIPKEAADDLLIITNVFVHPAAIDRQRVYINNYKAMRHALRKALEKRPNVEEILENRNRAKHPFKHGP